MGIKGFVVTDYTALNELVPHGIAVDEKEAAAQADVIVAVMGEDFNWSGEAASRTNIQLPGAQQKLLKN